MSYRDYLNEDGEIDEQLVRDEELQAIQRNFADYVATEVDHEMSDPDLDLEEAGMSQEEYASMLADQIEQERWEDWESDLEKHVAVRMTELEQEQAERLN